MTELLDMLDKHKWATSFVVSDTKRVIGTTSLKTGKSKKVKHLVRGEANIGLEDLLASDWEIFHDPKTT